MAETERNRNALRSQRLIREAFISLVLDQNERRPTVAQICRLADINRSTFYAHYDSLEDLELSLWHSYFDELEAWLTRELERDFFSDPLPGLNRLGELVTQYECLFQVFGIRKTEELVRDVEHEGGFGMAVRESLLKAMGPLDDEHIVQFDFVCSAMLNVYYTWFSGQYGNLPLKKLNERLAPLLKACYGDHDSSRKSNEV